MKTSAIITPGIVQNVNGHWICNCWKFIDLNYLSEEDRDSIEQYIDNINNGIFIREDDEHDINIIEEKEYQLNINDNEE